MLRGPRQRLYRASVKVNPRHPLLSRRARRHWTEKHLGGTKDRGLVRSMQRHSRVMAGQIWPELHRTGSPRYKRRNSGNKRLVATWKADSGKSLRLFHSLGTGYWVKGAGKSGVWGTFASDSVAIATIQRGIVNLLRHRQPSWKRVTGSASKKVSRKRVAARTRRKYGKSRRRKSARGRRYARAAANPRRWTVKWRP